MTRHTRLPIIAVFAAAALCSAALPLAAQQGTTADNGFNPDTGQINRGVDAAIPSNGETRPIPSQEEARAALMSRDSDGAISLGETASPETMPQGASASADRATTGMSSEGKSKGPIGATFDTMPSKFSERNDILDRVPTMAWPLVLDEAQRQRIVAAVMADETKQIDANDNLKPAHILAPQVALNGMHPLPPSLNDIQGLQHLSYVKTGKEVFLVLPATRVVVDRLGGQS